MAILPDAARSVKADDGTNRALRLFAELVEARRRGDVRGAMSIRKGLIAEGWLVGYCEPTAGKAVMR